MYIIIICCESKLTFLFLKIWLFHLCGGHVKSFEATHFRHGHWLLILPQIRFRSAQSHFLHVLMLWSDSKPIHMHRYRNHNFVRSRIARRTTEPVRCQTSLDTLPFGSSILKPDFNLMQRCKIVSQWVRKCDQINAVYLLGLHSI